MDKEKLILPIETIENENVFFEDINEYNKYVDQFDNLEK